MLAPFQGHSHTVYGGCHVPYAPQCNTVRHAATWCLPTLEGGGPERTHTGATSTYLVHPSPPTGKRVGKAVGDLSATPTGSERSQNFLAAVVFTGPVFHPTLALIPSGPDHLLAPPGRPSLTPLMPKLALQNESVASSLVG